MNNTYRKLAFVGILCTIILSKTSWTQKQNDTIQKKDIKIEHYIRKMKTDTLFFAGDELNRALFKIEFPDSLYSAAKVTVKRYIIDGIRGVRGTLLSKEKTFYKVRYQVKGHRRARKFLEYLLGTLDMTKTALEAAEHLDIHGKKVKFTYDTNKRYHYFIFRLPEASLKIDIK
ncbi:MAG: hypothetical protein ACQERC_00780 [Bacteroidota bacterium]